MSLLAGSVPLLRSHFPPLPLHCLRRRCPSGAVTCHQLFCPSLVFCGDTVRRSAPARSPRPHHSRCRPSWRQTGCSYASRGHPASPSYLTRNVTGMALYTRSRRFARLEAGRVLEQRRVGAGAVPVSPSSVSSLWQQKTVSQSFAGCSAPMHRLRELAVVIQASVALVSPRANYGCPRYADRGREAAQPHPSGQAL